MLTSLSVFFPCFNESASIPLLLEKTYRYIPKIAKKYEVIIVDDGSVDECGKIVSKLCEKYPNLRLVRHKKNLGYGATLRTGIASSTYDWIFWTDADLQFDITSLDSFIPATDKYDVIIGYRSHRADTFIRKLNGQLYTWLINLLFFLRVRDIDCGFKLIKRSALEKIHIETSSAFTSSEILIKLKKNRVKFRQIPVAHFPRAHGSSTGGSIRVIIKGLWQTLLFFCKGLYGK